MTYFQARDDEQLSHLHNAIGRFISRYNANPSWTNRKTIILFPGGMGSELLRANAPYSSGGSYIYDILWLDAGIMSGKALQLRMQGDVDDGQQIVIPDGPLEFLLLRPYEGFIQWCNYHCIDYFIFGWDWRRDPCRVVQFFLDVFMPVFRLRVQNVCYPNPLQHLSLVGHSFGGMIVKLILNRCDNQYARLVERAVTVASPFYGHGGQLPRYFVGDPDLNHFYDPRDITRAVSSMAGGYTLQFLDESTYQRDSAALATDPDYPLLQYPSLDATNGTVADPYNPMTNGAQVRYPLNYGFDPVELNNAKATYQQVAAPLDPTMNSKFFNIRGVRASNTGVVINDTVNNQTWDWIAPTFNPISDPCPITDYRGPGDGTLPAWSTRLVTTPPANVRTLRGAVEHMFMMSDAMVLSELATVI